MKQASISKERIGVLECWLRGHFANIASGIDSTISVSVDNATILADLHAILDQYAAPEPKVVSRVEYDVWFNNLVHIWKADAGSTLYMLLPEKLRELGIAVEEEPKL